VLKASELPMTEPGMMSDGIRHATKYQDKQRDYDLA
jgi:hypothetical protein